MTLSDGDLLERYEALRSDRSIPALARYKVMGEVKLELVARGAL